MRRQSNKIEFSSVANESLEFESQVESRIIDVESSYFIQTTLVKSSLSCIHRECLGSCDCLVLAVESFNIVWRIKIFGS